MGSEDAASYSTDKEIVTSGEMDTVDELVSAVENLTRFELDLACCSEKLINLGILVMNIASRESDFEAFALGEEDLVETDVVKALEFDFLYGYLECEVRELERFLYGLRSEILSSSKVVYSFKHLGDVKEIEEKIQGCEDSVDQSLQQLINLREQFVYFKRNLGDSPGSNEWKDDSEPSGIENGDLLAPKEKLKTQTPEQQRNILKMLEKCLAREMDLENKLNESRQNEEDLKAQLLLQGNRMEQEVENLARRLLDAENTKEVFFGILKEFHEKVIEAESRAETAESESETLKSTISGMNNELNHLKLQLLAATRKSQQLEMQLKISEEQRLDAVVTAEAGREIQIMSAQTIKDMEILIKDLKFKISRAETQTESAEEKCILLSETNAELTEVINHLRSRVEELETSLHQANEAKKKRSESIREQVKLITDLLLKFADERERLRKEVLPLTKSSHNVDNKSQQIKDPTFFEITRHDLDVNQTRLTDKYGGDTTSVPETTEEIQSSSTRNQTSDLHELSSTGIETDHAVSTVDSSLETVRNIDAGQIKLINFKYIIGVVLFAGITGLLLSITSQT